MDITKMLPPRLANHAPMDVLSVHHQSNVMHVLLDLSMTKQEPVLATKELSSLLRQTESDIAKNVSNTATNVPML